MSTKYRRKYRRLTRGTPHAKARAAGGESKSTAVETSMSEVRERKRGGSGEHTSRQNASISRAITYLNAVSVISCCPLFDNNLRPPATTRFLAATNENRNKTRAHKQLCVSTDYGCRAD